MDLNSFQGNSNVSKNRTQETTEQPKKVEKIVHGTVKRKKRNQLERFTDIFLPDDIGNLKDYVIMDVLVPMIKKSIMDTVDTLLNGSSGSYRKKSGGTKVSYRGYYESERDRERNRRDREERRYRNTYDYDTISIDSRGEAEDVLDELHDLIARYGIASVGDFYELVGVRGTHTDNKYGWTSLKTATVSRNRDGSYSIRLPKPMPID